MIRQITALLLAALPIVAQTGQMNRLRVIPSPTRTSTGVLEFAAKDNQHHVGLSAPDTVDQSVVFKLPAADGPAGSCFSTAGAPFHQLELVPNCVGPNILSTGGEHPLFVYSHFRDDDENTLRISFSRDGVNWSQLNKQGVFKGTGLRDPSIARFANEYQFVTTGYTGASLQFLSTPDLVTFPETTTILDLTAYIPGATATWAPEWFVDPNNGRVYIWVAASTASNPFSNDPGTFNPYLLELDPTTKAVLSVAAITLDGTTQSRTFDYFCVFRDGLYYILYVDQQTGDLVQQPFAYATSTTIDGPYTQQTTPGDDHFNWGHSFQTEAPIVFPLANGCFEIVADVWTYPSWGGRSYKPYYQTSCPAPGVPLYSSGSLSSATEEPRPMNISRAEHGTIIALQDVASTSPIYNAQARSLNDNLVGSIGINTDQPEYMLHIAAKLAPSGGIQFPEPATLALDAAPGHDQIGTITACGTYAQSCWPGVPGKARLFQYTSGDSAFGMFQFLQANPNGESSVMFADGIFQPGQVPQSSTADGDKAIWTIGENNAAIDLGPGNHRFFVYNKGIDDGIIDGTHVYGGFPLEIDPHTGEVRANWGITLGKGNLTAYGHEASGTIWSSADFVIEMGRNDFTNHDALVKMGGLVVDHSGGPAAIHVTGDATAQRNLMFESSGSLRWNLSVRNGESTGNAGSDIYFDRLNDAGGYLDSPLWISRANGNVIINKLNLNNPLNCTTAGSTVTVCTNATCTATAEVLVSVGVNCL